MSERARYKQSVQDSLNAAYGPDKLTAALARVAALEAALREIHGRLCGPYGVKCQCTVIAERALKVKP